MLARTKSLLSPPAVLALLVASFSLSACAQAPAPGATDGQAADAPADAPAPAGPEVAPGSAEARAVEAIRAINPRIEVEAVGPAPIDGFREVIVSGQVVYVSDDGRYLLQGSLFDVPARRDLSEEAVAKIRRALLAEVPKSERIVFAPASPKYTVSVFTDVECGYCRKLHQEIAEYNRLGIAVEYLAFPRMGPASEDFAKMEAVWCAPDRAAALTAAKADQDVPRRACTSPVARHYALGQRIGLAGTPLIVAEDGTQLPGYMPPAALLEALENLQKNAAGG
ncbi:DsbC family protein [Luteimonas huabeiensis]|uniref:DsbC family protein n=1 Tax=Luteimonas huabeiensis TaxID=1244513 RepID=UPI000467CEBD|nr:DsbC family protein [Luteimonas huabeiensis]